MIKDKISTQEIIDLVASKASVSKRSAEEFLKVMIASIEEALVAGEVVKIKNFGTFKLLWNEPRKSVNIQSKEEIMLAGYYKASFTPDLILRNLVNEPFAHLEPVELNDNSEETIQEDVEIAMDPLRVFTEQASEIKDLISEIQALTPIKKTIQDKPKTIEKIVQPNIIQSEDLKNYFEEQMTEQEFPTKFNFDIEQLINQENNSSQQNHEKVSEIITTPLVRGIKPKKSRKTWLIILVVLLSVSGTSTLFLFFYPPVRDFSKQIGRAHV